MLSAGLPELGGKARATGASPAGTQPHTQPALLSQLRTGQSQWEYCISGV